MDFDYSTETITPDNTGTINIGGTGALILPSGTTVQRGSAVAGMLRVNTDTLYIEGYMNGAWYNFASGGAVGGGADRVFYENDITITTNYTITTNKNAMTAGPIAINSGVTVTIPTGSVWTVL
jgi:hypothetical protein